MKKHSIVLSTGVLLFQIIAGAGALRAEGFAGSAGAFLRMGAGSVAMATGDAGVARAIGVEQAFYNPAGLPYAPSSEVHAGYHILSLDRSLAQIGVMVQIRQLTFWSEPLIPLEAIPPIREGGTAHLMTPGGGLGRSGKVISVDNYLDPLADAVLRYSVSPLSENEDPIFLMKDGSEYIVPSLRDLVVNMAELTNTKGWTTREEIRQYLEKRFRKDRHKPAAVALTWTHAGTDKIDSRDFDGNRIGELAWYENRFALSFGAKVHERISLGVTAGVLYALIPDILEDGSKALTSTTFGVDAGVQVRPFLGRRVPWRLETLSLGAAAYGIGAKNSWNTTGYWELGTTRNDKYPNRYRVGLAYSPVNALEACLDFETDLKDILQPKAGVEIELLSLISGENDGTRGSETVSSSRFNSNLTAVRGLALRAGVDRDRPTFGLGFDFGLKGIGSTRLDYAYVLEPVSPEATQVVSWRFRF